MKIQQLIKKHVLLVFALLFPYMSYGQQEYFYSTNGKKVYMEIMEDRFVVKPVSPVTTGQTEEYISRAFANARAKTITGISNFYEIRLGLGNFTKQELREELSELKTDNNWAKVYPVYLINGSPAIVYDIFVVKLKEESEFQKLKQLNDEFGVELIDRNDLVSTMITLRVPDNSRFEVVELARIYFERLELEWSAPDFKMETVLHSNDPYYPYQFYMNMISADRAWEISLANHGIVVAVLDQGVEAHEDLPASQLINGYDAFGVTVGAPGGNEAHGMASAGIIAANHNTKGVAGLAPNVKIMPVRVFNEYGQGTTNQNIADAMSHAVTNGADIINNSWGYTQPNGNSVTEDVNPALTTVINNANQNGRSGLGTIIIFAAGNNGQAVTYPAFLNSVTAVGAIDNTSTIFNYSNTGISLDIVAPSGTLGEFAGWGPCGTPKTELTGTVWTLDRDGTYGWNPGDHEITNPTCFSEYTWSSHSGEPTPTNGYTANYGGTSAAAPQVSGVTGLLLSVNPNLTSSEINTVLQNSADKVSGMNGLNFTK